ncbi:GNAT family N-acetyltransferase [Mesobacillus jeotgali]|uniref:GNAT family N-acetyltransferase n=1 Tax=Mesobacillus jeotgali TaxID=129985 RepID=UPI001787438B|nr:GNAT family N-acetyltransferase [Mesobacillus jeotgali]UYZ24294.1 GNAT family N-acetyltransferase [Mesobacillus jeotgali]
MVNIVEAQITDLDAIVQVDRQVIGNTSRKVFIEKAIKQGRCILVNEDGDVAGFLIYDTHFFECTFISLIIVSPAKRRKGYASQMMNYLVRTSLTEKIFSSTNRSNESMQKVFKANGFIQSGIVENLDEGDPEIIYFKSKSLS